MPPQGAPGSYGRRGTPRRRGRPRGLLPRVERAIFRVLSEFYYCLPPPRRGLLGANQRRCAQGVTYSRTYLLTYSRTYSRTICSLLTQCPQGERRALAQGVPRRFKASRRVKASRRRKARRCRRRRAANHRRERWWQRGRRRRHLQASGSRLCAARGDRRAGRRAGRGRRAGAGPLGR